MLTVFACFWKRCAKKNAGVTQLVECDLAKVDVAGSNPVSRSNIPPKKHDSSAQRRPRNEQAACFRQLLIYLESDCLQ